MVEKLRKKLKRNDFMWGIGLLLLTIAFVWMTIETSTGDHHFILTVSGGSSGLPVPSGIVGLLMLVGAFFAGKGSVSSFKSAIHEESFHKELENLKYFGDPEAVLHKIAGMPPIQNAKGKKKTVFLDSDLLVKVEGGCHTIIPTENVMAAHAAHDAKNHYCVSVIGLGAKPVKIYVDSSTAQIGEKKCRQVIEELQRYCPNMQVR